MAGVWAGLDERERGEVVQAVMIAGEAVELMSDAEKEAWALLSPKEQRAVLLSRLQALHGDQGITVGNELQVVMRELPVENGWKTVLAVCSAQLSEEAEEKRPATRATAGTEGMGGPQRPQRATAPRRHQTCGRRLIKEP